MSIFSQHRISKMLLEPEHVIKPNESHFKELRKRKLSNETDPKNPTRCCVCGEMNEKNQMTMAPKQNQMIFRWSQVFGHGFLETCTESQANQYICAIHWVQLRDDWEGPLPEILENMRKENNGSFKHVMILNGIDKEGNWSSGTFESCRYCCDVRARCEMVLVPIDQTTVARWINKLGPSFYQNIKINSTNYICWRHFNLPNLLKSSYLKYLPKSTERSVLEHPVLKGDSTESISNPEGIQLGVQDVKPKIVIKQDEKPIVFEKCRYCDNVREMEEMVLVPDDRWNLARWVKILGSTFLENLENGSTNYICWSHFKLPNSLKSYYLECSPNVMNQTTNNKQDNKKMSPEAENVINPNESMVEKHFKEMRRRNVGNETQQDNPLHPEYYTECCVCGETKQRYRMKVAPKQEDMIFRWSQLFGQKFLETCTNSQVDQYVCLIHWKQLRDGWKKPFQKKLDKMKNDKNKSLEDNMILKGGNEEGGRKSETDPTESQFSEEPAPHLRSLSICCICGEPNWRYEMTLAPKQKHVLEKWSQVLGPEFFETCWKRKRVNHYFCSIHWKQLRYDWEGPVPEVLERMKKKNIGRFEVVLWLNSIGKESDEQEGGKTICRYCGNKCIGADMTNVPENKEGLLQWAEILGEEFLRNVKSYTVNKICWSHFKYRDPMRRSAHNLPMTDEMMEKEEECNEGEASYEQIESEGKPDIETLQDIVKTEEKDDQHPDYFEKDSVFLVADNSCSTNILLEDEEKPRFIIKDE